MTPNTGTESTGVACTMNCVRLNSTSGLFTDFYELTMMQGYLLQNQNHQVVFDMFFRRQPFKGGFSIFAGLDDALEILENIRFSEEDISYLESLDYFRPEFIEYLRRFRFTGTVYAMDEGSVVFPNEPLIRVHATLIEAQLIESMLLNIVNFQTLIATKTARIYLASKKGRLLEFGLRRAQGMNGALAASRASYIGGASATSNTLAGSVYGIPVSGTMAHSWIMSFDSELEAFRRYVEIYPDNAILLIDTYDTLESGLVNAITVGRELKQAGRLGKLFGVRLDSGDLQYLSTQARKMLDEAGLHEAVISASNELNEEIIHQLVTEKAPIDVWGVGTHMVTGGDEASLTGVYKLAAREREGEIIPTIKLSNNPEKTTNPGVKQVYRFYDSDGEAVADLLAFEDEQITPNRPYRFNHPMYDYKHFTLDEYARIEPMLSLKMKDGKRTVAPVPLQELRERTISNLETIDATYKRLLNPHVYKISLSNRLMKKKFEMIAAHSKNGRPQVEQ
jgi:nicotinate phosphoribosyltransferase